MSEVPPMQGQPQVMPVCGKCGNLGHVDRDCMYGPYVTPQQQQQQQQQPCQLCGYLVCSHRNLNLKCQRCGQLGHVAQHCYFDYGPPNGSYVYTTKWSIHQQPYAPPPTTNGATSTPYQFPWTSVAVAPNGPRSRANCPPAGQNVSMRPNPAQMGPSPPGGNVPVVRPPVGMRFYFANGPGVQPSGSVPPARASTAPPAPASNSSVVPAPAAPAALAMDDGDEDPDVACSICLDTFQDPKVLLCGHTFCSQHLNGNPTTCALCRKETRHVAGGQFTSNHALASYIAKCGQLKKEWKTMKTEKEKLEEELASCRLSQALAESLAESNANVIAQMVNDSSQNAHPPPKKRKKK